MPIPEIVRVHWYQYLLHTDYAGHLRRQLLQHGGTRLTVINVPVHFRDESSAERPDITAHVPERTARALKSPASRRVVPDQSRD